MLRMEGRDDVFAELLERKRSGKKGRRTKVALIVLGGVQRGVVGLGVLRGLAREGLTDLFDICVGTSAGAAGLAYFLAGQPTTGLKIHTIDAVDARYARIGLRGPVVHTQFLIDVARSGPRRLHVAALRKRGVPFFTDATEFSTGKQFLLDALSADPDPVAAVHASMMMPPPIDPGEVVVGGRRFVDGAIANPFPVREIVRRFAPTHLLVVTNQPRARLHPYMSDYAIPFLPWWPKALKRAALKRVSAYREGIAWLEHQRKITFATLWGGEEVRPFDKRVAVLKKAEEDAFAYARGLISKAAGR